MNWDINFEDVYQFNGHFDESGSYVLYNLNKIMNFFLKK